MKLPRLLLVCLVLFSIFLSSCQPKPSGDISFMVFGDPAELAAYQKLVDAFHATHPDIQVELIHIPGQADYRNRLAADLAAGSPADVLLINYRRYAAFADVGALEGAPGDCGGSGIDMGTSVVDGAKPQRDR